jgi:cytochrome c-type biogenesis protein CcmH
VSSRALKGWPAWLLLLFVVVAFLAVGASRASGPSTPAERADAIAKRVACPVCDGESVYESRNTASVNLRTAISQLVNEGRASDDEIVAVIERSYGGRVLLVPKASGFDALVWALPVTALVCAVAGLAVTFRRWRREGAGQDPTDDERTLVAAALAEGDGDSSGH